MSNDPKTERIRDLNDMLRTTFLTGRVMMTDGIASLPETDQEAIIIKVRAFAAFDPDNDPYDEHDFGSVEQGGRKAFWKIDYTIGLCSTAATIPPIRSERPAS